MHIDQLSAPQIEDSNIKRTSLRNGPINCVPLLIHSLSVPDKFFPNLHKEIVNHKNLILNFMCGANVNIFQTFSMPPLCIKTFIFSLTGSVTAQVFNYAHQL